MPETEAAPWTDKSGLTSIMNGVIPIYIRLTIQEFCFIFFLYGIKSLCYNDYPKVRIKKKDYVRRSNASWSNLGSGAQ